MDLRRANRVTAFWAKEGVAKAIFYKTHDRLEEVTSDDERVINAGFKFVDEIDSVAVTVNAKLAQYKDFIIANATVFGIAYDPVDRRADGYKFPNKYENEGVFVQCATDLLGMTADSVVNQLNGGYVQKMIEAELLPIGTSLQYGISETPVVAISESYKNGNLKYAVATYGIAFAVNGVQANSTVKVDMVSGQVKKPRNLGENGDIAFTATGLRNFLIAEGILPKKPEKVKEEKSVDVEQDSTADVQG